MNIWSNGLGTEILRTAGFVLLIWVMHKSLWQLLSVASECLGSHPPGGGVVLGSDFVGSSFFMYIVTT